MPFRRKFSIDSDESKPIDEPLTSAANEPIIELQDKNPERPKQRTKVRVKESDGKVSDWVIATAIVGVGAIALILYKASSLKSPSLTTQEVPPKAEMTIQQQLDALSPLWTKASPSASQEKGLTDLYGN